MKRSVIIYIYDVFIIAICMVIVIKPLDFMTKPIKSATEFIIRYSNPVSIYNDYKEKFTTYINSFMANDNTTTSNSEAVMNSINAEDSKANSDITEIPSDIKELMEEAEETISEEDSVGLTSEEAYQGGGTIISNGNIEIQSKIPESVYYPDIDSLLQEGSDLEIKDKSQPTILIYHSHTTEAYTLLDVGYYTNSDAMTTDSARNMIRVGDDLAKYLEEQGFVVIHDTEIHDEEYTSSYENSRISVEKYLEEYPSIEVTIDLHRDDITYSNKTKVKPTVEINGKKAARMMIISGCEYNRVKNFPDWEENLKFDLQVQNKVNELYPGVMRPILFSERKYNMWETHYSFLLEIGTDANTLDEACYSARMFGDALGKLLNEKYVKE